MDVWSSGDSYEAYMGRWSRPVAGRFLEWLALPAGARWLDPSTAFASGTTRAGCS
jgi:hypothetical protein